MSILEIYNGRKNILLLSESKIMIDRNRAKKKMALSIFFIFYKTQG